MPSWTRTNGPSSRSASVTRTARAGGIQATASAGDSQRAAVPGQGGLLFRSEQGNSIQPSTWWQVWQKVRRLSLRPDQLVTPLMRRPYDLRHSGVTWRLNSGVPATEVAAWAGHSVEVLMRVYAKCMTGLEDVWIARMNDALHLEDRGSAGGPEGGPAG